MKLTTTIFVAISSAMALASPVVDPSAHNNPIFKRECVDHNSYGCSKSYCWKNCDPAGGWCWTAEGDGTGDWISCRDNNDCNMGMSCGAGDCDDCGCSC